MIFRVSGAFFLHVTPLCALEEWMEAAGLFAPCGGMLSKRGVDLSRSLSRTRSRSLLLYQCRIPLELHISCLLFLFVILLLALEGLEDLDLRCIYLDTAFTPRLTLRLYEFSRCAQISSSVADFHSPYFISHAQTPVVLFIPRIVQLKGAQSCAISASRLSCPPLYLLRSAWLPVRSLSLLCTPFCRNKPSKVQAPEINFDLSMETGTTN